MTAGFEYLGKGGLSESDVRKILAEGQKGLEDLVIETVRSKTVDVVHSADIEALEEQVRQLTSKNDELETIVLAGGGDSNLDLTGSANWSDSASFKEICEIKTQLKGLKNGCVKSAMETKKRYYVPWEKAKIVNGFKGKFETAQLGSLVCYRFRITRHDLDFLDGVLATDLPVPYAGMTSLKGVARQKGNKLKGRVTVYLKGDDVIVKELNPGEATWSLLVGSGVYITAKGHDNVTAPLRKDI